MRGDNPKNRFVNLGNVTVPFGGQTTQESEHPGVDIANTAGTPIHAPIDGDVTKAEAGHVKGENNFGNTLEVRDLQNNLHQFHHLQNINVKPGQRIRKGQQIATIGDTGATYSENGGESSNLDYRIVDAYGRYKNPEKYLNNL